MTGQLAVFVHLSLSVGKISKVQPIAPTRTEKPARAKILEVAWIRVNSNCSVTREKFASYRADS
jgi:hypothetical protein